MSSLTRKMRRSAERARYAAGQRQIDSEILPEEVIHIGEGVAIRREKSNPYGTMRRLGVAALALSLDALGDRS